MSIDFDWVETQLDRTTLSLEDGDRVTKLLETLEELDMDANSVAQVLEVFRDLALGYAVVPDAPDESWVQAYRGMLVVGDQVRVKRDAYDGGAGKVHNGRRGKIVAIRHGDIIFKSTDNIVPLLDGVHYTPERLEKRVR